MIALTETASPRVTVLNELESLCASYQTECVKLEAMIATLESDLEAVKQRHLSPLKRQAALVASREAELHCAVESSPKLFAKPRTTILHGTKIGYASSIGSVVYEDEAHVVKLIGKHFKDRFDELVKTEHTPRKDALRDLTSAELARINCRIEGAGDMIILKRVSGDVEKLINRLIDKLVTVLGGK